MNAEIYKCNKVFSYSEVYRCQGSSTGGGQDEIIQANGLDTGGIQTTFDFSAIQPFDLTAIELNLSHANGDYLNVPFLPVNVGFEFVLNGQKPSDSIIVTDSSIPTGNYSNAILMGGFGTSWIDFTKKEPWRNITSMEIRTIVAYSAFGQYPSGPAYECLIGMTLNLYYKA